MAYIVDKDVVAELEVALAEFLSEAEAPPLEALAAMASVAVKIASDASETADTVGEMIDYFIRRIDRELEEAEATWT